MTTDVRGREYARLSALRPGDRVQVDDGFTCIAAWATRVVRADKEGHLYIACRGPEEDNLRGGERHYLSGQQADEDSLTGVYVAGSRS